MRPRVFPAEDPRCCTRDQRRRPSFNEAAGIPRGRLNGLDMVCLSRTSFNEAAGIPRGRPRAGGPASTCSGGFNEAAGIPRGRPRVAVHAGIDHYVSFNEAAGIPRGRLRRGMERPTARTSASMRPRVFPAEDIANSVERPSGRALQ